MHFLKIFTMAGWLATHAIADTNTYVTCGDKDGSHRLVVSTDAGYSTMKIYKNGEKDPTINATAALTFRRCMKPPCADSPVGIKTIDSKSRYNLALPWRAMESKDKFTAVLTEKMTDRLGELGSKTFNITCQPGVKKHELIASARSNK